MSLTRYAVELRSEMAGDTLRGYASVFGVAAELPGNVEQIDRHAFDAVLKDKDTDTRALINHDSAMLLGRQSSGTLRLGVDNTGLQFEVDLPDTSYARDLRVLVERGDLTGASFGFVPGQETWDKAPDGRARRTWVTVRQLVDVSPVTFPAYDGTAVSLRAIDYGTRPGSREQAIRARARVLLGTRKG